jgi:hypothetical protein
MRSMASGSRVANRSGRKLRLDVRVKVCNTGHHRCTTFTMYSQMFRRETARHLLAITDQVVQAYHARRSPWLNVHLRPSEPAIGRSLEMIAVCVAGADSALYNRHTAKQTVDYLELGMPPIAVLAAVDLLYEIILGFLTPDQRELIVPILDAQRSERQKVVQDYLRGMALAGA